MMRLSLFPVLLAALTGPAFAACEGQNPKGKVIFEDTFVDDTGGWDQDDNIKIGNGTMALTIVPKYSNYEELNDAFNAAEGDFCMRFSFPQARDQMNQPAVSLVFWAKDYKNYYSVDVYYSGTVNISRTAQSKTRNIRENPNAVELRKGAANAANEVRVTVKGNLITAFVNGKQISQTRGQKPEGDPQFGVYAQWDRVQAEPTTFMFRYYNVMAAE